MHVYVLLSQHHLLKKLSVLHWVDFALLSNIKWLCLCGYTSGLCSGLFISFTSITLIWLYSFTVSLVVRQCQFPDFVPLQYCIGCSASPASPYKLWSVGPYPQTQLGELPLNFKRSILFFNHPWRLSPETVFSFLCLPVNWPSLTYDCDSRLFWRTRSFKLSQIL